MLLFFCCLVAKSCPTLYDPMDCSPPGSMGFSRQENSIGQPFPSPANLPKPEIKPMSPAVQVDSLLLTHQGSPVGGSLYKKRYTLAFKKISLQIVKNFKAIYFKTLSSVQMYTATASFSLRHPDDTSHLPKVPLSMRKPLEPQCVY